MRRLALAAVALLAAAAALPLPAVSGQGDDAWKPVNATKVAEGLSMPVDIAFSPDGKSLYYVELKDGGIRRIDVASGALDPKPVGRVTNANWGVERGVFGLAVDPDFATTRAIYVSYSKNGTEPDTTVNVLSRFVDARSCSEGAAEPAGSACGNETVLLERPGNIMHNGGRILIVGEHLYLTSGDTTPITDWSYEKAMIAQDPNSMAGKVFRLTKEGKPAAGNPWGNAAWTTGHRNVFGIAYDPETGRLFVTENGSERADEVNLLEAGKNYGWPVCAGPCDPPRDDMRDPIVFYEETVGPTGATVFRGDLWFAEFNHGNIHRIRDTGNGTWSDEVAYHYAGSPPRILDLEAHPDGQTVWFSTWSEVWRLDFEPDPAYPPKDLTPTPATPGPSTPTEPTGDGFEPPTDDPGEANGVIPAAGLIAAAAAVGLAAVAARRRR